MDVDHNRNENLINILQGSIISSIDPEEGFGGETTMVEEFENSQLRPITGDLSISNRVLALKRKIFLKLICGKEQSSSPRAASMPKNVDFSMLSDGTVMFNKNNFDSLKPSKRYDTNIWKRDISRDGDVKTPLKVGNASLRPKTVTASFDQFRGNLAKSQLQVRRSLDTKDT